MRGRLAGLVAVASVFPVHEHVKQRAGEEYQPRKPAEEMSPMFRDQIEGPDGEKPNERDRARHGSALLVVVVGVACTVFHELSSRFGDIHRRQRFRYLSGHRHVPDRSGRRTSAICERMVFV